MSFVDFIVEGWLPHSDGSYSADRSDIDGHYAASGAPIRCPKCRAPLTDVYLHGRRDKDNDITHWDATCPSCKAKLTVFNDSVQTTGTALSEHIVKVKGGYRLVSKKSGKNLGTYPSKSGARKREREVEYFKHHESVKENSDTSGIPFDSEEVRIALQKLKDAEATGDPVAIALAQQNLQHRQRYEWNVRTEDAASPANNVGSGNIAGAKSGEDPPVYPDNKERRFAGARVFQVDDHVIHNARMGKHPAHRWRKYVDEDAPWGSEIKTYAQSHPKESIILQGKNSGAMIYLRRRPPQTMKEDDDYQKRKDMRRKEYMDKTGRKQVTCPACDGTGYYDNDGSPPCGLCHGTGKILGDKNVKESFVDFICEEHGAGFYGTNELTDTYASQTPGQENAQLRSKSESAENKDIFTAVKSYERDTPGQNGVRDLEIDMEEDIAKLDPNSDEFDDADLEEMVQPYALTYAHDQGVSARQNGLLAKDNPFAPGSPLAREWDRGYQNLGEAKDTNWDDEIGTGDPDKETAGLKMGMKRNDFTDVTESFKSFICKK